MHTARPDGKANDIIASVFLPLRSGKRSTTVLEFSRLFLGGRTAEAAYRLRFSSQSTRKAVRLAKVVYEPPALVGVGFVTAAWPDGELCQMKRLLRWQVHAASTLFFFYFWKITHTKSRTRVNALPARGPDYYFSKVTRERGAKKKEEEEKKPNRTEGERRRNPHRGGGGGGGWR